MKIRQKDKKKEVLNKPKRTYYASIPTSRNELKEPRELNKLKHNENAWKAKTDKAEILCEEMEEKNMINSKKQVSVTEKLNKCLDKQGSSPDEPEKRTVRDTIVTLLTKHILATAVQKQEMSVTEKCSDRNSMKLVFTDAEKHMALFAEKIGVQNKQSPQGSVGLHHSANMYAYGSMKDIQYRSYVYWKSMGIPNP
eukprot:840575-Ditylum_brightwellii.AAC.1